VLIKFISDCQQVSKGELFPIPRKAGDIVDLPVPTAAKAISRGFAIRWDSETGLTRIPHDDKD
jgi:hypothetical protein